jgi:phosphatidylserine decarboxylase
MPVPLKEWKNSAEVKDFLKMSQSKASHEFFFRNPPRVVWCNHELISSPADGVITMMGRYDPESDLIDVKGCECSVNSLLGPHSIDTPTFVTCIFMTAADVHWNRCPTDVIMSRYPLPPIKTSNEPMIFSEMGLLDSGLIRKGTFGFMAKNARVVNRCYSGALKFRYTLVQIADSDINCIVPIKAEKVAAFNQNERFGQIIWGSMCVLILPLTDRYRFKPLAKLADHVEAGEPLFRVDKRK